MRYSGRALELGNYDDGYNNTMTTRIRGQKTAILSSCFVNTTPSHFYAPWVRNNGGTVGSGVFYVARVEALKSRLCVWS
jgi:hypothetical protein